jgi:hypothetical protein
MLERAKEILGKHGGFMKVLLLNSLLILALFAAVVHKTQEQPSKPVEKSMKTVPLFKSKRTFIA